MEKTSPLSERFADKATEAIFAGKVSKRALKVLPKQLWGMAQRKMTAVLSATRLDDLKVPPGDKLHALEDDRKGQHAIRINDQYRICFKWKEKGATEIEVTDYH